MFDKLKFLQPILEQGLKLVESSKRDLMVITVVSGTCFSAGRLSTPPPKEKDFCSTHIGKYNTCKGEKDGLQSQVDTLTGQLQDIEDEYAVFIRELVEKKDKECTQKVGERIKEVKEQYVKFKCSNCKRLGRCK